MPYVLTFNKEDIEKKIVLICNYLNIEKNFNSFIDWIMKLRKDLKIPHKLSEVLDEKKFDLNKFSQMALDDPSTGTNPKKLSKLFSKLR